MQFDVLDTIDPAAIRQSSERLNKGLVISLAEKVAPVVSQLSPKQFIFLMGNLANRGSNFDQNLDLIDKYLGNVENTIVRLRLEMLLYQFFLKNYETEDYYNRFFNVMQKHFVVSKQPRIVPARTDHLVFFTHAPRFLAHTNPMFRMLENRQDKDIKITVASLIDNSDFAAKCREIDVNFEALAADNLIAAYDRLIELSWDSMALVWQCLPVNLAYMSSRAANLVWWSHKFHPNFENIRLRLGSEPNHKPVFSYFGKGWQHFDAGFDVANTGKDSLPWKKRKDKFGSFCREDLINNQTHWQQVAAVFSQNERLIYHYTGRRQIHEKWCAELGINPERVHFLGWLPDPAEKMREMMFLLDGPFLGQGLMAFEAVAGGVPVISPSACHGAYRNLISRTDMKTLQDKEQQMLNASFFETTEEICQIAAFFSNEADNREAGRLLRSVWQAEKSRFQGLGDFIAKIRGNIS